MVLVFTFLSPHNNPRSINCSVSSKRRRLIPHGRISRSALRNSRHSPLILLEEREHPPVFSLIVLLPRGIVFWVAVATNT